MCGILYVKRKSKEKASRTLVKRFHHQSHRGKQGFGYISINKGKIKNLFRFEEEKDLLESLRDETSDEILMHHRFPTSTPNIAEVAHPISVKNKSLKSNYYVIHNGVLQNEDELKLKHEELGFNYTTFVVKRETLEINKKQIVTKEETFFNDSESFAIDLALFLEGKQKDIESIGTISFICLETDKKNNIKNIHYGHNTGNPLVLEENENMFVLKSEGNGKKLESDILMTLDYKTGKIVENNIDIGSLYKTGFNASGSGEYSNWGRKHTSDQKMLPKPSAGYGNSTRVLDYEYDDKYYEEAYTDSYKESLETKLEELEIKRAETRADIQVCERCITSDKTNLIYNPNTLEDFEDDLTSTESDIMEIELELKSLD